MAKRKIAILGGGMAGLTAAWELTRTPQLAQENQVTVYQLGWRLGGKGASGRSDQGQILEHGLHIWFGCYDNAFRMLNEVYAEWQRPVGSPLGSVSAAFTPQNYALFGYDENGQRGYHEITFDGNSQVPGTGPVTSSLWDLVVTLYQVVRGFVHQEFVGELEPAHAAAPLGAAAFVPPFVLAPFRRAAAEAWALSSHIVSEVSAPNSLLHVDALKRATHEAVGALREVADLGSPREQLLLEGLELSGALVRGVLSDCYVGRKSLDDLDADEFGVWLANHASSLTLASSTLLKTMYDTFFWYGEGNPSDPQVGAGTAITVLLRALCTYKQAITFKLNAGMGEVVVAPMYEALLARGVRFEFFRKLTRLELDVTRTSIAKVHLSKQANVVSGKYQPTFEAKGLTCWPSEPDWAQLDNGAALKGNVDFESHWDNTTVGEQVLTATENASTAGDANFTHVILALSLGAYKKLNDDPGPCDELFAANPQFRAMADSMDLIPSQSAQLWSTRRTSDLGAFDAGYESVAGPQPQPIWADMSQVLDKETPPANVPAPASVHYGCGTYATNLFRTPRSAQPSPQVAANLEVRDNLVKWLNDDAAGLWSKARAGQSFDWNVLWDPQSRAGVARLGAQYVRANISPTECCPGTPPGSSRQRLRSEESGFRNLTLAGCYVRTGLNTTCVESAVMSGMQASRAVCGSPTFVVGERFGKDLGASDARAGGGDAARKTLPTYVSQLGMGQMSHEAPLFVGDVQIHAFRLAAQRSAMQRLVDANLNLPSLHAGSRLRFTVLGNSAYLAFLRSEGAGPSSPTNRVGKMDDREGAFFIPLLQRDGLKIRLTAWIPYLFIDRPIGMTMGREVWGYTKSPGVIHLPYDPQPSNDYVVNTTTLKVHAPNTVAADEDILRLRRPPQASPPQPEKWTQLADLVGAVLPEAALAKLIIGKSFPVINLKQFRDIADSKQACYQALVESPMQINDHFSAGLLDTHGYELDIFTCDSHQIVSQLGLAKVPGADKTTVKVKQGVWVKMDFTATHGRVLWQAT